MIGSFHVFVSVWTKLQVRERINVFGPVPVPQEPESLLKKKVTNSNSKNSKQQPQYSPNHSFAGPSTTETMFRLLDFH